ncbi:hypothetical protein HY632_02525 [Candidatus Uhrbacteria bacterium]|nr:hypothetical protein [Candidatus Uhrbacteria bacterium]
MSTTYTWFRPAVLCPARFAAFARAVQRMHRALDPRTRAAITRGHEKDGPPIFTPDVVAFGIPRYSGFQEAPAIAQSCSPYRSRTRSIRDAVDRILGYEGETPFPDVDTTKRRICRTLATRGVTSIFEKDCQTNGAIGYDQLAIASLLALTHFCPSVWVPPHDLAEEGWQSGLQLYEQCIGAPVPHHVAWVIRWTEAVYRGEAPMHEALRPALIADILRLVDEPPTTMRTA